MRTKNEMTKIALLLGLTFLLAGCGAADPAPGISQVPAAVLNTAGSPPPAGTTPCPSGQIRIGDGMCMTGTFQEVCTRYPNYGAVISLDGREVCQLTGTHTLDFYGGGSGFPYLSPASPAGSYISTSNVKVRVNDKITVDQVTGAWGGTYSYQTTFLGIPTTVWKTKCDLVTVDGMKNGTPLLSSDGRPAGLFGSDGTNAFFVGKGIVNQPILANGALRFGFNAVSSGDLYDLCSDDVSLRVKVAHCEDATGYSYLCP